MKKVVLISCVSKKRSYPCKARDLYISPLFRKNLQYASKLNLDSIFILSAKYGLVELDQIIEPYEQTLNTMAAFEIRLWANGVIRQLSEHADLKNDCFVFLAGAKYRKYLMPYLTHFETPFEGLTIGRQLQKLSN